MDLDLLSKGRCDRRSIVREQLECFLRGVARHLVAVEFRKPIQQLAPVQEPHAVDIRVARNLGASGSPEHDRGGDGDRLGLRPMARATLSFEHAPVHSLGSHGGTSCRIGNRWDTLARDLVAPLRVDDDHPAVARHDDVVDVAGLEFDAVDPSPDQALALGSLELAAGVVFAPCAPYLPQGRLVMGEDS